MRTLAIATVCISTLLLTVESITPPERAALPGPAHVEHAPGEVRGRRGQVRVDALAPVGHAEIVREPALHAAAASR